jgi:hypothetical protein
MLMLRREGRRCVEREEGGCLGVLEEWQLQNMHFQVGIAGQARKSRFVYMCNEHTPHEDFRKPESGSILQTPSNLHH